MPEQTTMNDIIIASISAGFPVLGTAVGFVIKRWFDKRRENKKNRSLLAQPSLSDHHIFSRIDSLRNHVLYSFTLLNKGKEEVFKDILINNLEIWSTALAEVCEQVDNNLIDDSNELYNIHTDLLNSCVNKLSSYYMTNKYNHEEQRVLSIVMTKFSKWHYKRIERMTGSMDTICNSIFYSDVRTKAAVILDTYTAEFNNIIQDAQMTLNEINGDLSGLTFKGQII